MAPLNEKKITFLIATSSEFAKKKRKLNEDRYLPDLKLVFKDLLHFWQIRGHSNRFELRSRNAVLSCLPILAPTI